MTAILIGLIVVAILIVFIGVRCLFHTKNNFNEPNYSKI